jgi:hypothetical protein
VGARNLVIAVLLFGVVGCASIGSNFCWDAVEQVQSGMTTAEVRALLGEPTMVFKTKNHQDEMVEMWAWSHSKTGFMGSSMEAKSVLVSFENGVVAGHPTKSEVTN